MTFAFPWQAHGKVAVAVYILNYLVDVLMACNKNSSFVGRNAFSKQSGRSYIYLVAVRFTFIFTEDNGHRKDFFEAFFRFCYVGQPRLASSIHR